MIVVDRHKSDESLNHEDPVRKSDISLVNFQVTHGNSNSLLSGGDIFARIQKPWWVML